MYELTEVKMDYELIEKPDGSRVFTIDMPNMDVEVFMEKLRSVFKEVKQRKIDDFWIQLPSSGTKEEDLEKLNNYWLKLIGE